MSTAPKQGNQPGSQDLAPAASQNGEPRDERLAQLRGILMGPELAEMEALRRRLDDPKTRAEELSRAVAEAIAIRAGHDRDLQQNLQPIVEEALRISVARDPGMLATALFPIIGEAVRKAVTHALRGIVESINQMLDRSISPESWKWRVEAWRTGKSFGEIALMRSLKYRVEQVFLIHRETGLLLQHASAGERGVQDSDMISGMFTAIQDFVRDSFGGKQVNELEMMEVGEFKVWLQHGPLALLAAVVSGTPPPELRSVFERELEAIHRDYGAVLEKFDGDASAVAGTRENLQRCLLGGERVTAKKKPVMAWVAVGSVLLIAAILVGWRVRETRRWDHYVQRLRSEPGIVVNDAQRQWRGFSVAGLRDPLAPDPYKLMAAYRVPEQKVSSHWEPYLSLDPKFSAVRKLEADMEQIDKQVLRFDLSSSQLRTDQFVALETIVDEIIALHRDAEVAGKTVGIEVYGHTDRTGKGSTNVLLSQARAETVVRVLARRGVPARLLRAAGVGDQKARAEDEDAYPPELDRRVTFRVIAEDAGKK